MKIDLSDDEKWSKKLNKEIADEEDLKHRILKMPKSGGAKTSRSETVTVRLEPKIRYLAELAGRKQRRTLSSFIEWAIENALESVVVVDRSNTTVADESEELWDVDEPDRFVKLAIRHPDLLAHDEQKRWKLIRENGWLWKGQHKGVEGEWSWNLEEKSFLFLRLRERWDDFVNVANGTSERSILPSWKKNDPLAVAKPLPVVKPLAVTKPTKFDDMDDDIPF